VTYKSNVRNVIENGKSNMFYFASICVWEL